MIDDIKKDEISAQELNTELDEVSGGKDERIIMCRNCGGYSKVCDIRRKRCPKCGLPVVRELKELKEKTF